jgi:putative heme transporter
MTQRHDPPATRADLLFAVLFAALLVLLWLVRSVVVIAAFALILAYILDPLANLLGRIHLPGRRTMPRPAAAVIVVLIVVGGLGAIAAIGIPLAVSQAVAFIEHLPQQIDSLMDMLRSNAMASGQGAAVENAINSARQQAKTALPQLAGASLKGIGGLVTQLDQVLTFSVLPVLTYYLLADQRRVRESLLRFLPEGGRENVHSTSGPVHRALKSYVRGQAVVCLTQGVATGTMLAIAGLPNALLLGLLAGLGEILPFIGALVAGTAIVLSGLTVDLLHAVLGLTLYMINNSLLQIFVTPRVMERYLKIHPFVVIVSVLSGLKLFGPPGAILALPTAAVVLALIEDPARQRKSVP